MHEVPREDGTGICYWSDCLSAEDSSCIYRVRYTSDMKFLWPKSLSLPKTRSMVLDCRFSYAT